MIWGVISHRLVKMIKPEEGGVAGAIYPVGLRFDSLRVSEKFRIANDYPDPFFKKEKGPKKAQEVNEPVVFPELVYKGMLAPKQPGRPAVFFLLINGTQAFLTEGKQIEGMRLVRGDRREILVRFQQVHKTISIVQ